MQLAYRVNEILAPFAEVQVAPIASVHGLSSRLSIPENSCNSRTTVYEASVKANCSDGRDQPLPMHVSALSILTSNAIAWSSTKR